MKAFILFICFIIKSLEIIEECLIVLDKQIEFSHHYFNLKVDKLTSIGYFEIINQYYKGYVGVFIEKELIQLNEQIEVVWIKCKPGIKLYLKNEKNEINDFKGDGVDVFVLDGQANLSHIQFKNIQRLYRRARAFPTPDSYNHGTAVASKISGKTLGLAKESNIIMMNVMNYADELDIELLKKNYKIACDLSIGSNAIINISSGYTSAKFSILKGCDHAIVVTSAGNSRRNCTFGRFIKEKAIVVGSINPSGQKTYFSNYGDLVDVYVNGKDVLVASGNYNKKLELLSGTSFSAPYISGFLAVIMSQSRFKIDYLRAKRILKYFSTYEKQEKDYSKYQRKEQFKQHILVFPDRFELNNIRIFGQF